MKPLVCIAVLLGGATTTYAQDDPPPAIVAEVLLINTLAVRHGDAAMGDFDQDGDLDMLLTGAQGHPSNPNPSTVLYRSEGDTTLIIEINEDLHEVVAWRMEVDNSVSFPRLWKSSADWGDFDSDGDLDLALMGLDATGLVVTAIYELVNLGGSFAPEFFVPEPVDSGDLAWSDVDNDGDLDLIVCGNKENGEPLTAIYENSVNEQGGWQVLGNLGLPDVGQCSLDFGDFEADGDQDIVIAGTSDEGETITRVYENNGRGRFSRYLKSFEDFLHPAVAWGDFDADGYLEFVVTGGRLSPLLIEGGIRLYGYDTSSVDFTEYTSRITGAYDGDPVKGRYHGGVAWGDINNDGYQELIITGAESPISYNSTQIYLNRDLGNRLERSPSDQFGGGYLGEAVIADFDMDGDLDAIVFGESPGLPEEGVRIRVLRSGINYLKNPPLPPDAISHEVTGRSVTLRWSPGQDRLTPPGALTYNVRVGTSPGAANVVSPMADLQTGERYVTRRGSQGTARSWTMYNLSPGTYYWAVQALDHTYNASGFSYEETFTVR